MPVPSISEIGSLELVRVLPAFDLAHVLKFTEKRI